MTTKPWGEIRGRGRAPEKLAQIDRKVVAKVLAMDLREIREFTGVSQAHLAELAKMNQPDVSRLESRGDYLLSTLRRVINALGGDLEVAAVFGKKRLVLRTTDPTAARSRTARPTGAVRAKLDRTKPAVLRQLLPSVPPTTRRASRKRAFVIGPSSKPKHRRLQ